MYSQLLILQKGSDALIQFDAWLWMAMVKCTVGEIECIYLQAIANMLRILVFFNQIQAISYPHRCVFFAWNQPHHCTLPSGHRGSLSTPILEHCHLDRSMEVWNAFWLLDRLTYAPRKHTRKGGVWVGCILVLFIRLWYVISVCTLCMWLLCFRVFPFLWRL